MKLQTLALNTNDLSVDCDQPAPASLGFWQRQFMEKPTGEQKGFDWTFGVVLPLICFAADPIVFVEHGLLHDYQWFAYAMSATSIMAMVAWLLWGQRLGWLAAPLAGLFIAGSFISLIVGVLLFPYSFMGMFFIIGFLGYTPLISAFIYLRSGIRAARNANLVLDERSACQATVLAAMLALVIPYVANEYRPQPKTNDTVQEDWGW